jgi:membrane associated rhomboid family serine protease
MIPISDENPSRRPALVTWAIVGLCVAAYAWEWRGGLDAATAQYGFVPASVTHIRSDWTLPASLFLHGGLLHLGFNLLFLWIFGNNVEDAMGHVRFALFYLLCGVAGALAVAAMDPHSLRPLVGASGAVSGVLAAYMLLFPRSKVNVAVPLGIVFYPLPVSAIFVAALWFGLALMNVWIVGPSQPGTAWWAHVGGFVLGLALTPVLKSRDVPLFGPRPNETGDRQSF